ncbi:TPA: hypothetical protein ROX87_005260 [Bacillus thuringiensis]|uniref:hypothetical protein n=1 Tax=Bacillus TaxID=1386 RepID=UPI00046A295C|nr:MULTISPECIES: hypothetical protein [Bacillus]PER42389.1 hypothetical protein CN472_26620 [Bacillus thuringiensis]HDX9535757.1 hypothetical protein [Bacillus thuringiensis]
MKRKVPLTILVVVILGIIIYYNRTVESKIQGFPVPARAEYVYQEEHKDYEYKGSCFSNGLPYDYQLGLWFAGWKTQKADGAMIKYKKDDRVVVLVLGGNAIYMYEEGKTQ